MLCRCSPVLQTLEEQLDSMNERIHEMDAMIKTEAEKSAYAVLLDSIPGVGPYGTLGIASEIGDVSRYGPRTNCSHMRVLCREYTSQGE